MKKEIEDLEGIPEGFTLIEPLADSYIAYDFGNKNYGASETLIVGLSRLYPVPPGLYFICIKFPPIPDKDKVTRALLRMKFLDIHTPAEKIKCIQFAAIPFKEDWNEYTITFNNQPAVDRDKGFTFYWIYYPEKGMTYYVEFRPENLYKFETPGVRIHLNYFEVEEGEAPFPQLFEIPSREATTTKQKLALLVKY